MYEADTTVGVVATISFTVARSIKSLLPLTRFSCRKLICCCWLLW